MSEKVFLQGDGNTKWTIVKPGVVLGGRVVGWSFRRDGATTPALNNRTGEVGGWSVFELASEVEDLPPLQAAYECAFDAQGGTGIEL